MDFKHFSFYFSSKTQQILLPVNVFKNAEWMTVFCLILSESELFAQAYLPEYLEHVR